MQSTVFRGSILGANRGQITETKLNSAEEMKMDRNIQNRRIFPIIRRELRITSSSMNTMKKWNRYFVKLYFDETYKRNSFHRDDKLLKRISSNLRLHKSMRSIDFGFEHSNYVPDRAVNKGLKYINRKIKSLNSLQTVGFNVNGCWSLTAKGICSLIKDLKYFPRLNTINLVSKWNNDEDEGLKRLSQILKRLISLKIKVNFKLKLYDSDTHRIYDLSYLYPLRTVSLDFSDWYGLIDGAMVNIGQNLKSLTSLQYLTLDLSGGLGFSEKGISGLKDGLKALQLLHTLTVNFNGRQFSDNQMRFLSFGLRSLCMLQHLTLSFMNENCWLSDEGVRYLSLALKSLTLLQSLDLSFTGCVQLIKGLVFLSLGMKHLTSLQDLNLSFAGCNKLTDESLKYLGLRLRETPSLRNLKLTFTNYNQFTNKELKYLGCGFTTLQKLQTFNLTMTSCRGISDEGLRYLSRGLKYLSSLQRIFLSFAVCGEFSDEGIAYLNQCLSTLSLLQMRHLRFSGGIFKPAIH